MVAQQKEDHRRPDLILEFPEGTYDDALRDYVGLREWAAFSGQCFASNLTAIVNGPRFRGKRPPSIIEGGSEWMQRIDHGTEWQTIAEYWTTGPEATEHLQAMELPERAKWREAAA